MNHTQFLCYGLLKIFLKEAIDANSDAKGLLCSYFLKTALFWEITTTSNDWNPSSLLSCIWKCFLRLLHWVVCSYCPNFFIPQNNMFAGKIESTNRDNLLRHMMTLYHEGYRSILRCRSITVFTTRRPAVVLTLEPSKSWIALNIIGECYNQLVHSLIHAYTDKIKATTNMKCLLLHKSATSTIDNLQRFMLRIWFCNTLTPICMAESNNSSAQGRCNKSHYRSLTRRLKVMQRFAVDSVTHILYQAMLCYKAGKYNQALRLVQHSKEKMVDQQTIYIGQLTEARYRRAGGETLPIETMLRKYILYAIIIEHDLYISELYVERHFLPTMSSKMFGIIFIPPIVCAFFLQYLCQRGLKCQRDADEAIYELSLLLENQHYYGRHIHNVQRDISWQILGICQQLNGNDWAACRSFLTVLQESDMMKKAACIRLGTILVKYFL